MEPPFPSGAEPGLPGTPHLCLLACSPHPGGSSDAAAAIVEQTLAAHGVSVDAVRLHEQRIRPCVGCGHCTTHPGHCVFDGDDATLLFRRMDRADSLILTLPVYFYGPPALLKGFIDRAQIFWTMPPKRPFRPAYAVICAARTRGERLFEANLLILRCFLNTLGFELRDPLLLRGVEGPADLSPIRAQLQQLGSQAAEQALRQHHD